MADLGRIVDVRGIKEIHRHARLDREIHVLGHIISRDRHLQRVKLRDHNPNHVARSIDQGAAAVPRLNRCRDLKECRIVSNTRERRDVSRCEISRSCQKAGQREAGRRLAGSGYGVLRPICSAAPSGPGFADQWPAGLELFDHNRFAGIQPFLPALWRPSVRCDAQSAFPVGRRHFNRADG